MPRTVEVNVPASMTDTLLRDLAAFEGRLSIKVQRGGSVIPPGDVITVTVPNRRVSELHVLLGRHGVGREQGTSITASEPVSVISAAHVEAIVRDSNEATWEEIEQEIASQSNMTLNMMLIMAISGWVAAAGIVVNALHLVIGAMIIAPGFEPLARIALGAITRSRAVRHGLLDVAKGYAALFAGALLAGMFLTFADLSLLEPSGGYEPPHALILFWTQITPASVTVSLAAGLAGGILVATHRAVLTAGVMVALALIPTVAIAALALLAGEFDRFFDALLRWVVDAAAVVVMSLLVFARKRMRVQRRDMLH